eukprot:COSAG01_NODE_14273_length_1474_cov_1.242182_1_plen_243_part_10
MRLNVPWLSASACVCVWLTAGATHTSRAQSRKGKGKGGKSGKGGKGGKEEEVVLGADGNEVSSLQAMLEKHRAVTGNLASRAWDLDVKIDKFTMSFAGPQLVGESTIELTQGCRYGLIGDNGTGKTNLINALALREVPIPVHIDMYHLDREAEPTDRSAVEAVSRAFPSWKRSTLTEIYLCHACSCHEILRAETPGQVVDHVRARPALRLHAPHHLLGGRRDPGGGGGARSVQAWAVVAARGW